MNKSRWQRLRTLAATLFTIVLTLTSVQIIAAGEAAAATSTMSGGGITVSFADATATTGTDSVLTLNATVNCASVDCSDAVTFSIERPKNVDPDAELQVSAPGSFSIKDARGPNPTITVSGLGSQNKLSFSWVVGDNPAYPGESDIAWSMTHGETTLSSQSHVTITGTPKNTVMKETSKTKQAINGYVSYELKMDRKGNTGLLGTLVDTIPAGMELVSIATLPEVTPEIDPVSGDVRNVSQIVDRNQLSLLSKTYVSCDNGTCDKNTREIRITVDKNLDNALRQDPQHRLSVRYTLKIVGEPANGSTWDNTFKWQNDTVTYLDGKRADSSDIAPEVTRSVKKSDGSAGNVGKAAYGMTLDQVNNIEGVLNYSDSGYFNIAVRNGETGPLKLTDTFRPQYCVKYANNVAGNAECEIADKDADQGYYFRPQHIIEPSLVYLDETTRQAVKGIPPHTVTFTASDGRTEVVNIGPIETSATYRWNVSLPEDFVVAKMEVEYPEVLSQEQVILRVFGKTVVPAGLFAKDDGTGMHPLVYIANDLVGEYQQTEDKRITANKTAIMPVRQSLPEPLHVVTIGDSRFGSPNNGVLDTTTLNIRPVNAAQLQDSYYRPYGVLAFPHGFRFVPKQPNENQAQRCVQKNTELLGDAEGKVPFDPRAVYWYRLSEVSPGGGEVWSWTVPENMVLPANSNDNNCQVVGKLWAEGAKAGDYNSENLASEFPKIASLITIADPDSPISLSDKTRTYTDNSDYKLGCGRDGKLCKASSVRWNQVTVSASVQSYATANVKKYAEGDKDGVPAAEVDDNVGQEVDPGGSTSSSGKTPVINPKPAPDSTDPTVPNSVLDNSDVEGDNSTTVQVASSLDPVEERWTAFRPGNDELGETSYATHDATFFLNVGSAGSIPVKDYVLYDALPAASWIPLNELSRDQATMAGTHTEYDANGAVSRENVANGTDLVPLLAGPLELPNYRYFDEQKKKWVEAPMPAEVFYSTSDNPCRPEMSRNGKEFPAGSGCTEFNAHGEWKTAEELGADFDYSQVKYLRVEFTTALLGTFDLPVRMTMPENSTDGNGIEDWDIAVNRVATRATDSVTGSDLGTVEPAVARVAYVPELAVNKAMIIPAKGQSYEEAKAHLHDGDNPEEDHLLGVGDEVYFQISVSTPNTALIASPVIRDFIPQGLEYVSTVPEHTVGQVLTDYEDHGNTLSAEDQKRLNPSSTVVWQPGPLNDQGVHENNGSVRPAVVTMKLRITDGVVGTVTNTAVGGTVTHSNSPNCEPKTADQVAAEGSSRGTKTDIGSVLGCDAQQLTIAPSISGSVFDLGEETALDAETPRVTGLETGDLVATLLDANGEPVRVDPATGLPKEDGEILTVPVNADGSYRFPKVVPGDYQVRLSISDDEAAAKRVQQKYVWAPADTTAASISAEHIIDGGAPASNDTVATTPRFTVAGRDSEGQLNPAEYRSVPNVDFAMREVRRGISLSKTADSTAELAVDKTATFTLTGGNTGNVDLSKVQLTEPWIASRNATVACTITSATGEDVTNLRGDLNSEDGATLAVGDTYRCTVTFTATQEDVNNQQLLNNTASIRGEQAGEEVTAEDTATYPVVAAKPALEVTKTVNEEKSATLGLNETGRFTITVRNTGNVTLKNVGIADVMTVAGGSTQPMKLVCGPDATPLNADDATESTRTMLTLAPDEQLECVTEFTADQAFLDAQQAQTNTVSVTATALVRQADDTVSEETLTATDNAVVRPVVAEPAISATKEVSLDGKAFSAQVDGTLENQGALTYRITVKNTGNVAVRNITIADTLRGRAQEETLAAGTCTDQATGQEIAADNGFTLAAGQTVYCLVPLTYTQEDLDRQVDLVNTVDVTGDVLVMNEDGNPVLNEGAVSDKDNVATVTPPAAKPELLLVKRAAEDTRQPLLVGDKVTYYFDVTNTGNTTIRQITIEDKKLKDVTCPADGAANLAVGQQITCSGTYTVTEGDVSATVASSLVNTATASGQTITGTPVTSNEAAVTLPTGAPNLTVTKTPIGVGGADLNKLRAGDQVTYQIQVTNNGTATLTGGTIVDDMLKSRGVTNLECQIPGQEDTFNGFDGLPALDPQTVVTCAATIDITQEDVDASVTISNTVVAKGSDANGKAVPDATATAAVETLEHAGLTLAKSSNADGDLVAGDTVTYTFTVTNTGDVTLRDVTITDEMLTNRGVTLDCTPQTLAPGEHYTCTSQEYTVQPADVGVLTNTASYTSMLPSQSFNIDAPTGESNTVSDNVVAPGIAVDKTITDKQENYAVGDTIAYELTVRNTGETDLTNVKLVDALIDERVRRGDNSATAVECAENPALTSADGGTLAKGAAVKCSAALTVTQADVDGGASIDNTASVEGRTRKAPVVKDQATAAATLRQDTGLTLKKQVADKQGLYQAGDTVRYEFTVENTGQRTIKDLTIDDPMLAQAGVDIVCDETVLQDGLAAGETVTCHGDYVITDEDAATGAQTNELVNTATAHGVDPEDNTVDSNAAQAVVATGTPSLTIAKTSRILESDAASSSAEDDGSAADPVRDDQVSAGSRIEWAITVTNSGNAPAEGVVINDPRFADASDIACYPNLPAQAAGDATADAATQARYIRPEADGIAPQAIDTVAAGDTVTCFAITTVTQREVDASDSVINTATVTRNVHGSGDDTPQTVTSPEATATVPTATLAGITLAKAVSADTAKQQYVEGDEVVYTLTVTNTGTVTLDNIVVTDPMFGDDPITCPEATLAPGQQMECVTPPHRVTAAEAAADSGELLNVATVTAVTPADRSNLTTEDGTEIPTGGSVGSDAEVTVPVGRPSIQLTKEADRSSDWAADDEVTFTLTATNTGTTPLAGVVIKDPWFSPESLECDQPAAATTGVTLEKQGDSVTCRGKKTITQDEVDAQDALVNTARVDAYTTGIAADGESSPEETTNRVPVDDTATATITVVEDAALQLEKTIDNQRKQYIEGDTVTYRFTATNTGKVTLHNVKVIDPKFGEAVFTCEPATVKPGQIVECGTQDHVVTADEAAAGKVSNTATVTGLTPKMADDTPFEFRVRDEDTVEFATGVPALAITKTSDVAPEAALHAGDVITYTVTISNVGTTPAENVKLVDAMLDSPQVSDVTCEDQAVLNGTAGLAIGDDTSCTYRYTISQKDVDRYAGLSNTAAAQASFGTKTIDPVTATVHRNLGHDPKISLVKEVDEPQDYYVAGDEVSYRFTVTNEGDVTVDGLVINDQLLTDRQVAITCAATQLAPGETTICRSAKLSVTDADVEAGVINNVATVSATVPLREVSNEDATIAVDSSVVTSQESTATVNTARPALTISKTVTESRSYQVGEVIRYEIVVTNPGTIPVEKITVADKDLAERGGSLTCPRPGFTTGQGRLAAGEKITCVGEETVTQQQIKQDSLTNTATARGSFRGVESDEATASVKVPLAPREAGLSVKIFADNAEATTGETFGDGQTAKEAVLVDANTPITAAITIANTGKSPLAGVTVAVDGVNPAAIAGFTLAGDATPTTGTPQPGMILRVTPEGEIVFSSDETLLPLVLLPRQELSATVTIDGRADGVINHGLSVTGVNSDSNQPLTAADAFYTAVKAPQPGAISGTIFEDRETIGSLDPQDSGIADVTVELHDADGKVIATTTTDQDGYYHFDTLPAGDYVVVVQTPDGMVQSADPDNGALSESFTVTVTEGNTSTDVNFGYQKETHTKPNPDEETTPEPEEPTTTPEEPGEPEEPSVVKPKPDEEPGESSSSELPWWTWLIPPLAVLPLLPSVIPSLPAPSVPTAPPAVPSEQPAADTAPQQPVEQPVHDPGQHLLARTGANVETLALVSLLAVVGGFALMLVASRRRKTQQ
ncbi:SdrD B-like domain-containing protein [Corynebacterium choanae]|uniref:DUF7507 domain-containing protein n=1 Tax=Corynebacterium choanae TaxID=1862358 RepID=UPI0013DDE0F1|nr:SdrD B-like domain-containing protein [Corynebacterium choanae]